MANYHVVLSRSMTHLFSFLQKKKRTIGIAAERATSRWRSRQPASRLFFPMDDSPYDDEELSSSLGSMSVQPHRRRHVRIRPLGNDSPSPGGAPPAHKQARRSSIAASTDTPSGAGAQGPLTVYSQDGSSFGSGFSAPPPLASFSRPSKESEPICTSRLAAAQHLYETDSSNFRKVKRVLAAAKSIMKAEAWFAADATRGPCPPALQGHYIGLLDVEYSNDLIGEQRRYATTPCLFSLPKAARHAAAYELYVDGDLVGSELIALQEACRRGGIRSDALDAHLADRERQLASQGTACLDAARFDKSHMRDFSKKWVNSVVHGATLKPAPPGERPNATSNLFETYDVHPNAQPQQWLVALAREMPRIGQAVVDMPEHAGTIAALKAHPNAEKQAKANRWQSAIHFCLAKYECMPMTGPDLVP